MHNKGNTKRLVEMNCELTEEREYEDLPIITCSDCKFVHCEYDCNSEEVISYCINPHGLRGEINAKDFCSYGEI